MAPTDATAGTLGGHSSSASTPGIPTAPCLERRSERRKVVRSSSWVPPEVLRGEHLVKAEAQRMGEPSHGAALGGSGDRPENGHVMRTRSAEELEHYRMTAGILNEPYRDVNMVYELSKVLGEGSSGIIRKCFHKETGVPFACKTIPKSKLLVPEAVDDVKNEVQVMRILGRHPCILELKEAYEDHYAVHLILELCNGGDLYDRIQERKHYSEMEAARVCRRLLSAVNHFHSLGFMHRDIKPENILLVSRESHVDIRVADFGQAVQLKPDKVLTQTVGSVFYVAPEVLNRSYSSSADMWSVGIILYILLSGKPPFAGPNRRSTFELIKHAPVDFERDAWKSVSPEAKDLVVRLLDRNPETRISAEEAKLHPWMMKYCPTIQSQASIKKAGLGQASPMSTLSAAFSDFSVSPSSSVASSPSHYRLPVDLQRGQSGDLRPMIPAFARLGHGIPRCPSSSPPSPFSDQHSGSPPRNPSTLRSYASLPSKNTMSPLTLAAPALDGTGLGRKFSLDSGVPSGPSKGRRSTLRP